MPGSTSLGITYPCSGDTIDPAVLQTYAETTQDAIDATQALVDLALSPPTVFVQTSPSQSTAAGVTSVMTYGAVVYDTAAMFNIGSPTLITIQSAGTYLVNCWNFRNNSPTTLTSARAAILLNGSERAFHKGDDGTSTNNAPSPFMVSAVLPSLVVGDQITTTSLFTGSGNMLVTHYVSVTKISSV